MLTTMENRMTIGLSDLAHSLRKSSSAASMPISLGHAHQIFAATLGYKSLASYQAGQTQNLEAKNLADVQHAVLDYDLFSKRVGELGISHDIEQVANLVVSAFQDRASHIQVHATWSHFEGYLREQSELTANDDGQVNSEMAIANYDGVDEIYMPLEIDLQKLAIGTPISIDLSGKITLGIDPERPYSGHIVNVEGTVEIHRLGQRVFGSSGFQVSNASLDMDWDGDPDNDKPPMISTTQAYADLFGFEPDEVGNLADVEVQENTSSTGEITTGYTLDFTDLATPEQATKILEKFGSLIVKVDPLFFQNVRDDDWPN